MSHLLKGINTCLVKVWTAIDKLSIIWKSDLSNKIGFLLSCGCDDITIWMHHMDANKMYRENYTRLLRAILNKSRKQHLTKQQLYWHLPPISKTIQARWTRHVEHYWRSKNKIVTFFYGPLHMDVSVLADLQELIYISSVRTQDERERERERLVLSAQLDEDRNKVKILWHINTY